jgi:CrcB protein
MFQGIRPYLCVGLGGLVGSLCRYGLALITQGYSFAMPLGTLGSNIAGCFVIGAIAQLTAGTELVSPAARLFLVTGFCGGFTTLSSLIYELAQMVKLGEWWYAFLYLNVTFIGAVGAYYLGTLLVKSVLKV